jgi:DHA2 family multidrug resistance protein
LPARYRTEGSTLTSLARNYGSVVGVSVVISVLTRTQAISHAELTENVTPYSEIMRAPILPESWSITTDQGLAALQAEISRQAMAIGFTNDFTMLWVGALICVPFVVLLRRGARQTRAAAAE